MRNRFFATMRQALPTILAIGAIALATWEGVENRRHNRISLRPKLDASMAYSSGKAEMKVQNDGVGPAVVKDFEVYLDGKPIYHSTDGINVQWWRQLFGLFPEKGIGLSFNSVAQEALIPPGGVVTIVEVHSATDSVALSDSVLKAIDRVGIRICYCSLYDDQCHQSTIAVAELPTKNCRAK